MAEIASLTPTFTGVSYQKIDRLGSVQWPCNDEAPDGTPIMHEHSFMRDNGKGLFMLTEYVATHERTTRKFPLILTTGRILSQYNVGVRKHGAPKTSPGIRKIALRFIRMMPKTGV